VWSHLESKPVAEMRARVLPTMKVIEDSVQVDNDVGNVMETRNAKCVCSDKYGGFSK